MKIVKYLRKLLLLILTKYQIYRFQGIKFLYGFQCSLNYFKKIDKKAIVPIIRKNGGIVGSNCDIETGLVFHNCNSFDNLRIADNCHIGKNCFIDLRGKVNIHNNVVISMNTTLITHLDLSQSVLSKLYPAQTGIIVICDNVYIGANSTILMNVQINENAFVGACSLVNKNVQSFSLVAGIPVKTIKLFK